MKKLLPLLFLLALVSKVQAQGTVPNAGFETWNNVFTFMEPQGWVTTNQVGFFLGVIPATRTTDSHSGTYAMQLETKSSAGGAIQGGAVTASNTSNFGYPFTDRPGSLEGFYKYTPVSGDTGGVFVALYKWNPAMGQRDTIGLGIFFTNTAATTYTPFRCFISYRSAATPDTAEIIVSASSLDFPQVGSVIKIDDLSFSFVSGVKETNLKAAGNMQVYPNPCSNMATLVTEDPLHEKTSIRLVDVTGRIVKTFDAADLNYAHTSIQLPVNDVLPGMYLLQIEQPDTTPKVIRLQVQH
ncbi:MAG: T9SS type A sorting domain-containing protein [Hymenobacteraceae bacterium]|nr:T9SS type A sorting domain-containing protein [Hymenobacteraceae bacterium]MDX5395211.1 T9SS type A sorting domain-containing protein [Hymenobacteraceae bacterium]MDX5442283.1 T9SS type A sorting domain-containing protein [Hymenobacteraceae bacterium]MDX5511249.1 T9SS type A sorting domain-containing protein [Hymenobacteraceae bacterium]